MTRNDTQFMCPIFWVVKEGEKKQITMVVIQRRVALLWLVKGSIGQANAAHSIWGHCIQLAVPGEE